MKINRDDLARIVGRVGGDEKSLVWASDAIAQVRWAGFVVYRSGLKGRALVSFLEDSTGLSVRVARQECFRAVSGDMDCNWHSVNPGQRQDLDCFDFDEDWVVGVVNEAISDVLSQSNLGQSQPNGKADTKSHPDADLFFRADVRGW